MSGLLPRSSSLAGLAAFVLLGLTGCAASGYSTSLDRASIPDHAVAEPVQGLERSTICHKGRTITIVNIAVGGHLRHGDAFGACTAGGDAQREESFRTRAEEASHDG